jgi:hypothetical protein
VGLGVLVVGISAVKVNGETKAASHAVAQRLVSEALNREVYGDSNDRERLLQQALANYPGLAAAHWHLGHVNVKGNWLTYEEAATQSQLQPQLEEYRQRRSSCADTVAGQLALADWCRRNKLTDQERAHLSRVVELSPDHLAARQRLGHLLVNGEWLTADQRRENAQQAAFERKALGEWQPEMREIARGLVRGPLQRAAAELRLRGIADAAAIPAMELVISPIGEDDARLVVEVIAAMNQHEASVALARQAVYSPYDAVRQLACEKLNSRPREQFVPQLLASLKTPVISRSQIYRGRGGSLVCQHVLAREGQSRSDVAVLEREYQRIARNDGSREDSLARALGDAQRTTLARDIAISRENTETMALNMRVMHVLEESTNTILPPTPQNWWTWWNQENEVFVATDKPVRQSYQREEIAIVDRSFGPSGSSDPPSTQVTAPPATTMDCLAAGTKVWTEIGPLSIEEIRIGDRVLAQNPESGELAYKPVVGTTIRPASKLVRIHVGQSSITTSGGHLYWVAGEGWRKARQLQSGHEIHSVRGTVRVSSVESAEVAPTYNLIVADFPTYFVGEGLIFCHDNTVSQPTNSLVPGLAGN